MADDLERLAGALADFQAGEGDHLLVAQGGSTRPGPAPQSLIRESTVAMGAEARTTRRLDLGSSCLPLSLSSNSPLLDIPTLSQFPTMGRRTTPQWGTILDHKERRKAQNRLAQRKRRASLQTANSGEPQSTDAALGQRNAQLQVQPLSASPELVPALALEQAREDQALGNCSIVHYHDAYDGPVSRARLTVEPQPPSGQPGQQYFDFSQESLLDDLSFSPNSYSSSATNQSLPPPMPLPPEHANPTAWWLQAPLGTRGASDGSISGSSQCSPTETSASHPSTSPVESRSLPPGPLSKPPASLADAVGCAGSIDSSVSMSAADSAKASDLHAVSFEDRLQSVLSATRAAGFDSLDSLLLQYYTQPLERSPMLLEMRRRSRRRDLRQVLSQLSENAQNWSQWESQGLEDALMESAERIVKNEASVYVLKREGDRKESGGSGAATNGAGAAAAIAKSADQRINELRNEVSYILCQRALHEAEVWTGSDDSWQLPNTWSMLYETARSFLGTEQETSDFVRAAINTLVSNW